MSKERQTALLLSLRRHENFWVRLVLQGGADPNAWEDKDGQVIIIEDFFLFYLF